MNYHDESTDASQSRLTTAVAGSWVVTALNGLNHRLSAHGRGESATRLGAWTRRVVTGSYLFRWLTADPEPEVIVIDLKTTHTIDPVIQIFDRMLVWLDVAAASSSTVAGAQSLLAEFRAAPVRLISAVVALGSASAFIGGAALRAFGVLPMVLFAVLAAVGLAGTQVTASWADLVNSRVGRLVIATLEPPADHKLVDSDDCNE